MGRRPRKPRTVFKKRMNVGKPKNISVDQPITLETAANLTSSLTSESSLGLQSCHASSSNRPTSAGSASKMKLGNINENYSQFNSSKENIIIDVDLLNVALAQTVQCSKCQSFGMEIRVTSNVGLASNLEIACKYCKYSYEFSTSERLKSKPQMFDINVRLVYGLRAVGKGCEAAKTLCGLMNLPSPPKRFLPYVDLLGSTVEDVCFKSMSEAVEEAVERNEGSRDIPIAVDGSWQKRGYKSLNGVITATSFDTGKVIDLSILSKHCSCPDKRIHLQSCTANYRGSSGGMEVQGVVEIFNRSISTHKVRYTKYLGDGDSKGFGAVIESKPYGETLVEKLECVGHIQKRMGTRLRSMKSHNRGVQLSDGKGLSGKNRLTSAVIDQLQNYYGMAIRNSSTVDEMKKSIWAIYYHKISTDQNPAHGLCPKGINSWCGFQRAVVTKEVYKHKNSIPEPVMECVKPIFRDLSDPSLLQKCLHKKTQNPNESLNSVIWNRLPKTGFVGLKTLHFGAYEAVNTFNCGQITKCMVLNKLQMEAGKNTVTAMKDIDSERLRNSFRNTAELKKKARQVKRQAKRRLEDEEDDPDNPSYGAGMF